eukprot:6488268-Amphidinium_carterae.1
MYNTGLGAMKARARELTAAGLVALSGSLRVAAAEREKLGQMVFLHFLEGGESVEMCKIEQMVESRFISLEAMDFSTASFGGGGGSGGSGGGF